MTEEVTPYIQLNQEDIGKMTALASTRKQLLERKLLLARQFVDSAAYYSKAHRYIAELGLTEDIQ